jgi:hypothetical protein
MGLATIALMSALSYAQGGEVDVARLQQEVEQIKQAIRELQARLQTVEASLERAGGATAAASSLPASRSEPPPAAAPPVAVIPAAKARPPQPANNEVVALRRAWISIRPGAASTEVKELLGDPSQELKLNGKLAWYYAYPGIGAGSIFFNDNGTVSSRKSPFVEFAQ